MKVAGPQDENLFNDDTIFYFREGSADKKPGKAIGKTMHERIKDEDIAKFKDLEKIKDWRKVLSNMHYNGADYVERVEGGEIQPLFELDGLKWASVEHYYHANKFKKSHPEFYQLFTVESDSDISKDPAFAKAAGGKTGKYKKMEQGHATVFASFLNHRVNPVRRGVRQSLVVWFGGTPFK